MGANLYFMSGDRAVSMSEHRYNSEDILQKIIADNPGLLLRDPDPEDSRLMLVARELEIAEGDDSSNAYFLDHLLVDQTGVPVLVEVKRSTDTRARREVVAQMLDYASRVSTWDVDELREYFRQNNDEPGTLEAYDTDEFWMQVANCLKAERVKLVFVADRIPSTLKTLIEFMDRNMEGIEVYGVELRQYKTEEATMLTSSVVGETPLEVKRAATRSVEWDAASFSSYLLARSENIAAPIVEELRSYAVNLGFSCFSGHGAQMPTYIFKLNGRVIFKLMGWWKKSMGHICTLELCVRDVTGYLGDGWDEDRLRELLSDLPDRDRAFSDGLIWSTPQYIYIELRAISNHESLDRFKDVLKLLHQELISAAKISTVYSGQ